MLGAEAGHRVAVQQLKRFVVVVVVFFLKNCVSFCPCWETCEFDLFLKLLCYTVGILLARKPVKTTSALVVCSMLVSGL